MDNYETIAKRIADFLGEDWRIVKYPVCENVHVYLEKGVYRMIHGKSCVNDEDAFKNMIEDWFTNPNLNWKGSGRLHGLMSNSLSGLKLKLVLNGV